MYSHHRLLFLLVASIYLTNASPEPGTMWLPQPGLNWQYQLQQTVDFSVIADVYTIDLFDNDASVVSELHSRGAHVICYFSAGTYEDWREDASKFPDTVKGADLEEWPGEKWLDIRQLDVLKPIMEARMDACKAKGFDAIDFGNVDAWNNANGLDLSAADQLVYNKWLADAAHERNLSVGLKNDIDQIDELLSYYDFAVNEQCFQYEACDVYQKFIQAQKAVFNVEYNLDPAQFCPQANDLKFSSIRKHLELDAWRVAC